MTAVMSPEEQALADQAMAFAKRGSKELVRQLTDLTRYPADTNPVSVFMAGSPGAGKTEASIALLARTDTEGTTIRIDPDDLRTRFHGYTGANAWVTVDLLLKNRDNSPRVYKANIDRIDNYVPERYTEQDVLTILDEIGVA